MNNLNSQSFPLSDRTLYYDTGKSILLCTDAESEKKIWAKKFHGLSIIRDIIEDRDRFYVSFETDDYSGNYFALNRNNGNTEWDIPGRACFNIIHDNQLYVIFIDSEQDHYLLSINRYNGSKLWHHRVDDDLAEYNFRKNHVVLSYLSGKTEKISLADGREL